MIEIKNYLKMDKCLLLLVAFLAGHIAYAQFDSPEIIRAPQTGDFMKFGNIPVNKNAGLINLDIPVYRYEDRDFNIPISVSYNSSGFTPNKKSSAVGLNWFLNVGGVITRTVNDLHDDYDGLVSESDGFIIGVRREGPYTPSHVFNLNSSTGSFNVSGLWRLDGTYEGAPDEFNFNFNGQSGTFHIGNDYQPIIQTSGLNTLQIDVSGVTAQSKGIPLPNSSEIVITDGDGYKYYFGGDKSFLEFSFSSINNNFLLTSSERVISAWYLRKITAPNGREVHFDYGDYNLTNIFSNKTHSSHSVTKHVSLVADAVAWTNFQGSSYSSSGNPNPEFRYQFMKQNYLRKITIDDFAIEFDYSQKPNTFYGTAVSDFDTKGLKLDKVRAKDGSSTIRYVDFNYTTHSNRLFLSSLTRSGESPYTFDYNLSTTLPDPLEIKIDHWGFWKGGHSSNFIQTVIPTADMDANGDFTYVSGERDPNLAFASTALLNKVTYPTGGSSIFTYEGHDYSTRIEQKAANNFFTSLETASDLAGGARIKKIEDFDFDNSLKGSRSFYYVNDYISNGQAGSSSGQLLHWPRYYLPIRLDFPNQTFIANILKRNSTVNSFVADRNHVAYAEVAEVTSDGTIITHFSDYGSNPDVQDFNETFPSNVTVTPSNIYKLYAGLTLNDASIERGKMLSEKMYNSSNNLLSEVNYSYDSRSQRFNDYAVKMVVSTDFYVGVMKEYGYSHHLDQVTEITYDQNHPGDLSKANSVVKEYTYSGDYDNVIKEEKITNSNGDVLKTEYTYPFEIFTFTPVIGSDEEVLALWRMASRDPIFSNRDYIFNVPIEVVYSNNEHVTSGVINTFKRKSANGKTFVVPKESYILDLDAPIPRSNYNSLTFNGPGTSFILDSNYKNRFKVLEEDDFGNPNEILNNEQRKAYKWSSDGLHLIATVDECEPDRIGYTSFENEVIEDFETAFVDSGTTNVTIGLNGSAEMSLSSSQNITFYASWTYQYPGGFGNIPPILQVYDISGPTPVFVRSINLNSSGAAASSTFSSGEWRITMYATGFVTSGSTSFSYSYINTEIPAFSSSSKTGKKSLILKKLTQSSISKSGLPSGQYEITFWKNGGNPTISGGTVLSAETLETRGSWNLRRIVANLTGTLTISNNTSSNILIDELRVLPNNNLNMTTYTHDRQRGVTSITDPNLRSTSYTYDSFGRLVKITDHEGNILEEYTYHFNGQ